jgi:multicomponent K+:H+ antiporter subunit E
MQTLLHRIFPYPLLSAALLVIWLLIVNEASSGQTLLGAVLGIVIPWFSHRFHSDQPRIRRPAVIVKFAFTVLLDILAANLNVARLVLGRVSVLRPRFVAIPIELEDPYALTLLAGIITLAPGTMSADISADRKTLLIHVLHITDPDELIASIKRRYEAPLKEIFECSKS